MWVSMRTLNMAICITPVTACTLSVLHAAQGKTGQGLHSYTSWTQTLHSYTSWTQTLHSYTSWTQTLYSYTLWTKGRVALSPHRPLRPTLQRREGVCGEV